LTPDAAELVGLVPMAGRARRLGPAASSKEILPVALPGGGERPICDWLFASLRAAGVRRAVVVLRHGKQDVRDLLGDGRRVGLELEWMLVEESGSVPESLDRAYERVRGLRVATGFPDVVALPVDGLALVAARQLATGADVALGLVPTDRPDKSDMVELDAAERRILSIAIKPATSSLRYTWITASWGPRFTEYLHAWRARPWPSAAAREPFVSDVLLAALADGLTIEPVLFPHGAHLDIGTPDDLARASSWLVARGARL
jgi:glucose-1-phosphate thymidylyltransferase